MSYSANSVILFFVLGNSGLKNSTQFLKACPADEASILPVPLLTCQPPT